MVDILGEEKTYISIRDSKSIIIIINKELFIDCCYHGQTGLLTIAMRFHIVVVILQLKIVKKQASSSRKIF